MRVFRSAVSHAPLGRRMQLVIVIGDFHEHAAQARLITYHQYCIRGLINDKARRRSPLWRDVDRGLLAIENRGRRRDLPSRSGALTCLKSIAQWNGLLVIHRCISASPLHGYIHVRARQRLLSLPFRERAPARFRDRKRPTDTQINSV